MNISLANLPSVCISARARVRVCQMQIYLDIINL